MAEIVNLRLARKQKRRDAAAADAQVNRAVHGRTKAEREQAGRDAERATRHLDAHRRDTDA